MNGASLSVFSIWFASRAVTALLPRFSNSENFSLSQLRNVLPSVSNSGKIFLPPNRKICCFRLTCSFPDFYAEESENTVSFANLFWLRRNLSGWASRCSASHAASHHRMPWFKLFRNGLSLGKALFISSRYKLRYGSFKLRVFRVTTVALFSPFQIRLESVFPTSPVLPQAPLKICTVTTGG